ncbi:MAG TPA: hypothetical protein VGF48_20505 [Thermoanaerobaculia bacterium]|jgi:hypothetical protein
MNKTYLLLLALAALFLPLTAQAQTSCWTYSCDYIEDGIFYYGGTYWNDSNTTFPNVTDPCGGWTNRVADIGNQGYVEQTIYINNTYTSYDLQFNAYLLDDTDNWYDQLKVTVKNHNTNQTESFYLRGNEIDLSCGSFSFPLSNDYDNTYVTVRFTVSYLNLGTWYLDNVAFWGNFY